MPAKKKQMHASLNARIVYFKWSTEITMLLLRECIDKEVWCFEYGKKVQMWRNIATILRNTHTYEEELSSLSGEKCKKEYERNIKVYKQHTLEALWWSGSKEDFTEWHQVISDANSNAPGEGLLQ